MELSLIYLPETNSSPLKMYGWKTSFLLGWPILRGYVSFGEGIFFTCLFIFSTDSHQLAHHLGKVLATGFQLHLGVNRVVHLPLKQIEAEPQGQINDVRFVDGIDVRLGKCLA